TELERLLYGVIHTREGGSSGVLKRRWRVIPVHDQIMRRRHATKVFGCLFVALCLGGMVGNVSAQDRERADLAIALIKRAAASGELGWTAANTPPNISPGASDSDRWQGLALRVRSKLDEARAISAVSRTNFEVIEKGLTFIAVTDPEPTTKTIAAVAAW